MQLGTHSIMYRRRPVYARQ